MTDTTPSDTAVEELDVLVVGAGFAGIYQLDRLRDLGYSVKIYEAGSELGGIWYWNCYPGARVDTEGPMYQFSYKDLWKDWEYSSLYPSWSEVREYFQYLERRLDLSKDIRFDTRVTGADFDTERNQWVVRTADGSTTRCSFIVPCLGFASSPYVPALPGLDSFRGICHHTALWPQDGRRLHRQAGRGDRHRRQRCPGHPGGLPGGGRPDRVPADTEPGAADGPAHADARRTDGDQGGAPGSLRDPRRHVRRLRFRLHSAERRRPVRGGAQRRLRGALATGRLPLLARPPTRTPCSSRSPTTTPTRSGGTRSAPGSTTRSWPRSSRRPSSCTRSGSSGRLWNRTTTTSTTRTTSTSSTSARTRSTPSPRRASGPATASSTSSTSSCSRPASTPSRAD